MPQCQCFLPSKVQQGRLSPHVMFMDCHLSWEYARIHIDRVPTVTPSSDIVVVDEDGGDQEYPSQLWPFL